jgi:hypothetical protein
METWWWFDAMLIQIWNFKQNEAGTEVTEVGDIEHSLLSEPPAVRDAHPARPGPPVEEGTIPAP